jgi:hypothetical protein
VRVRHHYIVMSAMTVVLGACMSNFSNPREYLDEKTAATITVVAKPLVFAHERPELAAHSRDYVTLAGAAVNRTGKIDYFIFVYFWSTLDRRASDNTTLAIDDLTIAADDRQIHPKLEGHSAQAVGVGSAIGAPPGRHWTLNVYRSDLVTLHFLAESRRIAVTTPTREGSITYEVWNDQHGPLKALVRRLESGD